MQKGFKYQGFISYAHADERAAGKLHKALETFSVPKHLRDTFGKTISPIFRDTSELTAYHSLSDKIREAVHGSEFLIVICSPASKASHWVNEEIRLFRNIHGESSILCVLIEGTPETSFPPALLEGGREPIAANLSPQNFRHGVTQVAAAMLGLGLDDLVQRELKRYRRRVTAITISSVAAMLVMGTLTWTAVDARQEAEKRRAEAEGLIEFMLTDLKDKLDAAGSLEALEGVADKAANYYEAYSSPPRDLSARLRQAKAIQSLAYLQLLYGKLEQSTSSTKFAISITDSLLKEFPANKDVIFSHAQSIYSLGAIHFDKAEYDLAQLYFEKYLELGKRLNDLSPDTLLGLQEMGYAYNNLGVVAKEQGDADRALSYTRQGIEIKKSVLELTGKNVSSALAIAESYINLAKTYLGKRDIESALNVFDSAAKSISIQEYSDDDARIVEKRFFLYRSYAHLQFLNNDIEKAEALLTLARRYEVLLTELQPDNVDVKYNAIWLDVLEFDLAYIGKRIGTAKQISKKVADRILTFSDEFDSSAKKQDVMSQSQILKLYVALAENDEAKQHDIALWLKSYLGHSDTGDVSNPLKKPNGLEALILAAIILDDAQMMNKIRKICVDEAELLNFQDATRLRTVSDISGCTIRDTNITQNAVQLSLKQAVAYHQHTENRRTK